MANLILCGYTGKTGKVIENYLKNNTNHNIIGVNSKSPRLEELLDKNKVDIIIDFSNVTFSFKTALIAIENKIPFISGTTGFNEEQLNIINEKALENNVSILICSNFSKTINCLRKLLEEIAIYFDKVEITETHHISKLDKPSGTALLLKKQLKKDVVINSIRTTYPAIIHQINLNSQHETLTMIHTSNDREIYGIGIEEALKNIGSWVGLKTDLDF